MIADCKNVNKNFKLDKQITFHFFGFETRLSKSVYLGIVINIKLYSTSIECKKQVKESGYLTQELSSDICCLSCFVDHILYPIACCLPDSEVQFSKILDLFNI